MKHFKTKWVIGFQAAIILIAGLTAVRAANYTIQMSTFAFTPSTLTIGVGDTVTWTNTSGANTSHTTTSGNTNTCIAGSFWDSSAISSHLTYTLTFTNLAPGSYPYICTSGAGFHCSSGMKGLLIITNKANALPSVTITNPPAGSVFPAPATVIIQANASDSDGSVTNVQFLVGATVLANVAASPFAATTNSLPAGNYTFSAIASDNNGGKATNTVNIIVNAPPAVTITNPITGAVFPAPANVTIQANASDSDGSVTNVQFLVGATVLANVTASPFAATTNSLPAGNYTLSAIASDNRGAKATNSVSITVNAPPSVTITNPLNTAKFAALANIPLAVSVVPGSGTVTNVRFFSGASLLGNVTGTPYVFTVSNPVAGNYSFTAQAFDNFGAAATSAPVNVFVLTNALLLAPTLLADGSFQLTVAGIAGQTYATETTTNFQNWTPILTNVAPANSFNVTDTTTTNVLQRFYRARQDLN